MAEIINGVGDTGIPVERAPRVMLTRVPERAASPSTTSHADALPVLPNRPTLDWSYFRWPRAPGAVPAGSVETVRHQLGTTSGRAALYQALRRLDARRGDRVLVPTYHCPSMVAPIIRAGLRPSFFGIGADGLPLLRTIALDASRPPVAMIVPHYFGLPRSLAETRAWCDANGVVLVEDCAHAYFGMAGDRVVGHWGDYAVASLTKFFPLPEAGLLLSTTHPLAPSDLLAPSWHAELKGCVDVLELASGHDRLRGASMALRALFALKARLRRGGAGARARHAAPNRDADDLAMDCDMDRVDQRPLRIADLLHRWPDRGRIVAARRAHYGRYLAALGGLAGARPLMPALPAGAAPYVFPLLVDDAERVYAALRTAGMPVFRWDRVWPGTPTFGGDVAPHWQHHVLQLLCHQDLRPAEIERVCAAVARLLPFGAGGQPEAVAA